MTERPRQPFGRQNAADHAVARGGAPEFFCGGCGVLERQQSHAAKAAVARQKTVVQEIVVRAAELDGVFRVADLADVHEARRVQDRALDLSLVELARPCAPVRHAEILVAVVVRRNRAVPAVVRHEREVEHRFAPGAVARRHVFDDLFIRLAHVAVGVDDMSWAAVRRAPSAFAVVHETLLKTILFHSLARIVNAGGRLVDSDSPVRLYRESASARRRSPWSIYL